MDSLFELSYALGDDRRRYIELARGSRKTPESGDDQERIDVQDGVDVVLSRLLLELRKLIAHFVTFCCGFSGANFLRNWCWAENTHFMSVRPSA
jgi:hypothetical protein